MPRGLECGAHRHSDTIPQERHHIQPLSRGGLNRPGNIVLVCSNAHSDTHYLLDAIEKHGSYEAVPPAFKRTFGPGVKRLAQAGWAAYQVAWHAGTYAREAALWTSGGEPREAGTPRYADALVMLDAAEHRPRDGYTIYSRKYLDWYYSRLVSSEGSPIRLPDSPH